MKTEDLVRQISAQGPAASWLTVWRATLIWWFLLTLWALSMVLFPSSSFSHSIESGHAIGFYPGWPVALGAALVFLFAAIMGRVTFLLATPLPGRSAKYLACIAAVLAVCLILTIAIGYPSVVEFQARWHFIQHLECPEHMLYICVAPAAGFFLLTRRFGQFFPLSCGAAGFLAAGASGVLALQLLCPNYSLDHVMVYHLLPLLPLAAFGSVVFAAFGGLAPQVAALRRRF